MFTALIRALPKLFLVSAALVASSPLQAASAGSGSAFGMQTSLSAVPLLGLPSTLNIGPTPAGISGSAPPDFNKSGSVANVSGSQFNGGVTVTSGVVSATTQSTLLSNIVSSTADVDNPNLFFTLFGLIAQKVTSNATASCNGSSESLT